MCAFDPWPHTPICAAHMWAAHMWAAHKEAGSDGTPWSVRPRFSPVDPRFPRGSLPPLPPKQRAVLPP